MDPNRRAAAGPLEQRDGSLRARTISGAVVAVLFVTACLSVLDILSTGRLSDESSRPADRRPADPVDTAQSIAVSLPLPLPLNEGAVQPVASLPGWLEFDDDLRLSMPQRSMTARRRNARLDTDPPRAIRRDAPGPTQGRRYGVLELGELGHSFAYALDTGAAPRMYFDRNANGDLTDDGPPLKRQGSAYFGRRISIPAALLFDQSQGERGFAIWFWTTADWLAEGHASYYTRTQLQGTIQVDGLRRDAWIVDAGEADGRFFGEDDILWVDVNQDGSFERANESFRGLASLESTGLREAIQRSR